MYQRDKTVVLHVRVPEWLLTALDNKSNIVGITRSELMRRAVERATVFPFDATKVPPYELTVAPKVRSDWGASYVSDGKPLRFFPNGLDTSDESETDSGLPTPD